MIPWSDTAPFHGAKIALLIDDQVITFLRDDKPNIDWPGHWDFPGGGREGDESPDECVLREVWEEFEIALDPTAILWRKLYPNVFAERPNSVFMAATVSAEQVSAIRFGSEGQRWLLSSVTQFLENPGAVPYLRERLSDYLVGSGGPRRT